jgi:hypothetical protein
MEAIPEQEDLTLHEVTTVEVELETPQHHPCHALMRDYEEDPLRLEDDFDDLDDYLDDDRSNLDLGSVVTLLLLSPLLLRWLFDPISMENRIWGDRNGTCWCDANG